MRITYPRTSLDDDDHHRHQYRSDRRKSFLLSLSLCRFLLMCFVHRQFVPSISICISLFEKAEGEEDLTSAESSRCSSFLSTLVDRNATCVQILRRISLLFSFSWILHEPVSMTTTTSDSSSSNYVRTATAPPTSRLTIADLFDNQTGAGKPKLERLRDHLFAEGRLEEDAALLIIERGENLLRAENNLIDLEAPITGKVE